MGQQAKFWGLILPHGLLELTAVFIAGGAGLRLGWTLIDPGDRTRHAALAEEGRRALAIVAGLVVVFAATTSVDGETRPNDSFVATTTSVPASTSRSIRSGVRMAA